MNNILLYLVVLIATVLIGYHFRSLTISGSVAAIFVGGSVGLGLGWNGLIVLGAFFLTSSVWSKFKREIKKRVEQKHTKGSRRDWQQVLANGGLAAVFCILYYFFDEQIWLLGFSISLASANSDTWASEIGTLSKRPPVFIGTFKRVEKGTSGAVSMLGTMAALSGAFLIAITSTLLFSLNESEFLLIFLFGFLGNIIDTIFGAFSQVAYYCSVCGVETEQKSHCNQPCQQIRGFSFMDNDLVNFLSGFLATIAALILYHFL